MLNVRKGTMNLLDELDAMYTECKKRSYKRKFINGMIHIRLENILPIT